MLESQFKKEFKGDLEKFFPDLEVFVANPTLKRSSPDMIILGGEKWAALEFKRSLKAPHRPNQEYRISRLLKLGGYASFVYPENKEEVLNDLEKLFAS